jgi:hypothetical protein
VWDVLSGILNQNQAQIIPTNSAGLVNNPSPEILSEAVWNKDLSLYTTEGTAGYLMNVISSIKTFVLALFK